MRTCTKEWLNRVKQNALTYSQAKCTAVLQMLWNRIVDGASFGIVGWYFFVFHLHEWVNCEWCANCAHTSRALTNKQIMPVAPRWTANYFLFFSRSTYVMPSHNASHVSKSKSNQRTQPNNFESRNRDTIHSVALRRKCTFGLKNKDKHTRE